MQNMALSLINQKSALRKMMKETLKQISVEEKERQTSVLIDYLINRCERFQKAKHIALYLAMIHEEVNTIPLIETLLSNREKSLNADKHIYVPYVPMKQTAKEYEPQMVFYELKNMKQYAEEMNDNNRFKLRQFNSVENMQKADIAQFDLTIVPGLAFDKAQEDKIIRLGRGKGYYDAFLSKIPHCYTIGIGFNQQYLPLNKELCSEAKIFKVPLDETRDKLLDEFLCEKLIK